MYPCVCVDVGKYLRYGKEDDGRRRLWTVKTPMKTMKKGWQAYRK